MSNIKQSIANQNKAILSKEKIKEEQPTARQLSPKRSRLPGHRHTDQHNKGRHLHRNNREQFKSRYNQHTSSFRLSHKSSATSLSEHIWKLKENNTDHTVTWKILEKAQPYSPTTGKYNLCTTEKAYIAYPHPSLNKRRELYSTCLHRRKHLLSNLKSEEKKAPSGSAPRPLSLSPSLYLPLNIVVLTVHLSIFCLSFLLWL